MELHQLRYFVAVAETGNFTRASERSHVAQPSLSQQIIKLETEVGHKLFHRLGRKAVLTEAGTAFLDRAKRILFEVENAAKELGDHPNLGRRITVGAVQTVMPYLITPLIAELKQLHSNLLVDSQEDFRSNLVRAVVEGDLDLAVVPMPVKDHRIAIEPLLAEPLLLVVAKSHAIAGRTEISVNDLKDETFVSLGDSSSLAAQIRAFFGDQKFQPRISHRCAQVATLKQFVASGLGISLLPELARQPGDRDTLTYLRLTHSDLTRELVVIRHLQRYQSRGVEQFLSQLRVSVRGRGEPPRPAG
ncbi:MAG: LysR family transcriptional regulator [Opitutaceae bacterium]|nr:LysR family transcriptional regulator [Opitutaceae bacterium]